MAESARGGNGWSIGYRAPDASEPWIGLDILDVIDDLERTAHTGVIASAVGFVADHLEVLYDLDIEARACAEQAGLAFDRTAQSTMTQRSARALNGSPTREPACQRLIESLRRRGITAVAAAHRLRPSRAAPIPKSPLLEVENALVRSHLPFWRITYRRIAYALRTPHAVQLASSVGLGEQLVSPTSASAGIWRKAVPDPFDLHWVG